MIFPATDATAIWTISGLATAGVIARPRQWPEYVWAVAGAAALVASGLLAWQSAATAVAKGNDVYLFLTGMMLLSELARKEGLFDWLAGQAARHARGSGGRLFILIYLVGILVTVFLSNDATAVVLTPAVYAACRKARAEPLPYLFICAFVANAASFVLPISNPANLVLFRGHMPSLGAWLWQFSLPSAGAITATFAVLWWTQRRALAAPLATAIEIAPLTDAGRHIATGIAATAVALLAASLAGIDLGLPTFAAGIATAAYVLAGKREWPAAVAKDIAWGVLPLVAGLFVLVEGLQSTGVIETLRAALQDAAAHSAAHAVWWSGGLVALACNLVNNLPAGLVAGSIVEGTAIPVAVRSALLVGVDLGPNLSVTGSLATILWLVAIRREGGHVGGWMFLKLGALAMPPALALALAAVLAMNGT